MILWLDFVSSFEVTLHRLAFFLSPPPPPPPPPPHSLSPRKTIASRSRSHALVLKARSRLLPALCYPFTEKTEAHKCKARFRVSISVEEKSETERKTKKASSSSSFPVLRNNGEWVGASFPALSSSLRTRRARVTTSSCYCEEKEAQQSPVVVSARAAAEALSTQISLSPGERSSSPKTPPGRAAASRCFFLPFFFSSHFFF